MALRRVPRFQLIAGIVVILGLIFAGWLQGRIHDRHPGYAVDLTPAAGEAPGPLRAGFAAVTITPTLRDTWTDANGDARYDPDDGDTFADGNGNGRFDAYWLAGFHAGRPAAGVHDPLWARAVVFDDGRMRVGLVVLDLVGFMHPDVIEVRRLVAERTRVDYLIVCSTHTHHGPDMLGLWGRSHASGGRNPQYGEFVRRRAAAAVVQAVENLRPARLRFAQDLTGAAALVTDTRRPHVLDPGIRLIQAVHAETGATLGVVFAWADHPETAWSHNLLVSSDFPHYVREGLERGVFDGERRAAAGLGGTAVYVNGAIGGLMTTNPGLAVPDPFGDAVYTEPSWDKVRAEGQQLALLGLAALRGDGVTEVDGATLRVRAKTLPLHVRNRVYQLGVLLGLFERGFTGWAHLRTEVAAVTLGPASFLVVPGEIYPEIVNGGITAPPGQDFALAPVEVPPLREFMPGEFRFVLGLANDELGYIIPKSEWDNAPPWIYGATEETYGEIVSPGPEAAPTLYAALRDMLAGVQE